MTSGHHQAQSGSHGYGTHISSHGHGHGHGHSHVHGNHAPLSIRLTEPITFLRGTATGEDFRGRRQIVPPDAPPAILRGLLTLRLNKPTRIKRIEVRLEGKSRTEWPEGIGPRRTETSEEHLIVSQGIVFFDAAKGTKGDAKGKDRGKGKGKEKEKEKERRGSPSPWPSVGRLGGGSVDRPAVSVQPGPIVAEDQSLTIPLDRLDGDVLNTSGVANGEVSTETEAEAEAEAEDEDEDDVVQDEEPSIEQRGRARGRFPSSNISLSATRNKTKMLTTTIESESTSTSLPPGRSSSNGPATSTFNSPSPPRTPTTTQSSTSTNLPINGIFPRSSQNRKDAILTRERGPSPAYSFRDPLQRREDALPAGSSHSSPVSSCGGNLTSLPTNSASDTSLESGRRRPSEPSRGLSRPGRSASGLNDELVRETLTGPSAEFENEHENPSSRISNLREADVGMSSPATMGSRESTESQRLSTENWRSSLDDVQRNIGRRSVSSSVSDLQFNSSSNTHTNSPQPEYYTVLGPGSGRTSLVEQDQSQPASNLDLARDTESRRSSHQARTSDVSASASVSSLDHHPTPPTPGPSSTTASFASDPSAQPPAPSLDRGRKSSKFSFTSALRGLSMDVKERVVSRSRSRLGAALGIHSNGSTDHVSHQDAMHPPMPDLDSAFLPFGRGGAGARSASRADASRRTASPAPRPAMARDQSESSDRGRSGGSKVLNGIGGMPKEESTGGHNWKEFKKGVYNYPISFSIPADLPPTIHADFGSVVYRLKAVVHRAGALTPNYVDEQEITLVASPPEDDTEDTENVIVERQWDDQMSYLIALSGKAFPIGGQIPLSLRIMPLAKCSIYRLSATIEEKIDYFAMERRVARHEAVRKYPLLALKNDEKPPKPLLPIISDDPNAVQNSPLAPLAIKALSGDGELDDAAASLLNPTGPWHLECALSVPDCSARIRFSSKHAHTNMAISHWLKVVMRVERGDDTAMDSKGRRKLFDIIIETPLHLLNCRVNTQLNTLPTYAPSFPISGQQVSLGTCRLHRNHSGNLLTANEPSHPAPIFQNTTISGLSAFRIGTPSPNPASNILRVSGTVDEERPDSLLNRNIVFDRLVSGQESEAGETPPPYEKVLQVRDVGQDPDSGPALEVR